MTNIQLRSIDIPQLYRFGVGFDTMVNRVEEILRQNAQSSNYPPLNVIQYDENHYAIELAIAGWAPDEITVQVHKQLLKITGKHEATTETEVYLHKGISKRSFEKEWILAEHVQVIRAVQENGILRIELERIVPEEDRPKTIDIKFIK